MAEEKKGFFKRLVSGLTKTRDNIVAGFDSLFTGYSTIDDDFYEELEEILIMGDIGINATTAILDKLKDQVEIRNIRDPKECKQLLIDTIKEQMTVDSTEYEFENRKSVILVIGVNGVGKTTSVGKLAGKLKDQGKKVILGAADTFRAAAVEQLQVWGQRNNIPVIAQHTGADSASVIFDAIQAAKARNIDVLIADTAGRLQNKSHLMEELKKIVRVMKKLDVEAPHEVMLTIDASTGQNAVSQAKLFHEAVGLTGITLTKLDGTAKGGVIFSVADQFGIPIRYIGVGERIEDLRPFKADDFIEALFARED